MAYQEFRKAMVSETFFIMIIYVFMWIVHPYKESGYQQAKEKADEGKEGNAAGQEGAAGNEDKPDAENKKDKRNENLASEGSKSELTKEIFQLFAIHGVALGFGLLSPFVFSMVITYLHFGCFLAYFAIGYKKPEKKMPKLIIKNVMYLFNLFLICAGASEV